ncbi:GDP-L-fucose synthase family protein [Kiloniella litopenaei]|uniref:GDP-L-fucose synthase family protein n=1 Tax=Kiloniella litopenaei TaxID=1549748 RepID=UPI003BAB049B
MKIWIAGHKGMVGQALSRRLMGEGHQLLTINRRDLDLRSQQAVHRFVAEQKPDWIFITAAHVGGIQANASIPADFLYDNLMIATNILSASYQYRVPKVLMVGSSCMYPKLATQPVKETELLTGSLEPTNEGYAIAKIAGVKLAQFYRQQYGCDFITSVPAACYGPGDNLDATSNHVIPGLIRRMTEARDAGASEFPVWGTGKALREFLFVDDLADGLVYLMENYSDEAPINIGSGIEISIGDLAVNIAELVGFKGKVVFDTTKPDGMPRKILDSSRILSMGWKPKVDLTKGLEMAYRDFMDRVC